MLSRKTRSIFQSWKISSHKFIT